MKNRVIKFRAWIKNDKSMWEVLGIDFESNFIVIDWKPQDGSKLIEKIDFGEIELMQYTGVKDKNGKEIYEYMELNNKYEVIYQAPSYLLKDISTGDIMNFNDKDEYEITREYTKV